VCSGNELSETYCRPDWFNRFQRKVKGGVWTGRELVSVLGLDIDVFDARGVLDEFIDAGKLQKPLYVVFAVEQSEVVNLLRANESSVDGRQVSGRVAAKALLKDLLNGNFEGRNRTAEIEALVEKTHMLVSSKGVLWWK